MNNNYNDYYQYYQQNQQNQQGQDDGSNMNNYYGQQQMQDVNQYQQYNQYQTMGTNTIESQGNNPNPNLWVGNLAPQMTENDLRNAFSTYGIIVSVKYLPHKGCAFIRFSDTQTAMYAYQHMNGYFMHGKPIKLGWGKETPAPQQPQVPETNATSNLWVGNVGPTVTEEDLRRLFGHYGNITMIRMLLPKNCAFVNFDNVETATKVKAEMQGYYFAGQYLKINYGKELKTTVFSTPSTSTSAHPGLGSIPKAKPNEPIYSQILQGKLIPTLAQPPQEEKLRHVIDTTIKYVLKHGQYFENKVKINHKSEEGFQFLFGGEGSEYYKWAIYKQVSSLPNFVPQTINQFNYNSSDNQNNGQERPLLPIELNELTQLIENLSPTQASIRMTKNWIIARPDSSSEIVNFLKTKIETGNTFEQRLNISYLINDILHHSLRRRQDENIDVYCPIFEPHIPYMVQEIYSSAPAENDREKVLKLIRIWGQKGIFDEEFIYSIEKNLTSLNKREREDNDFDPNKKYKK